MQINSGSLDERISFERATAVGNGGGGETRTWDAIFACAAKVAPLSGKERDNASQTQAPRNYRITVRRSSETAGVTEADRIDWRGIKMQIRFIANAGPRVLFLTFDCESGVNT